MNLVPLWLALGAMAVFTLGVLVGAGMVCACVREHVALCDLTDDELSEAWRAGELAVSGCDQYEEVIPS